MIDIIIPAYNAHDTIEKTLFSIAIQDNVDDFNVYIINDCSNCNYSKYVSFFSNFMKIQELKLNVNSGPGVARNYGINHSNGDFIVFIDSDDVLYDCLSIKKLYDATNDTDVVVSSFLEEVDKGFLQHNRDKIWLHGKMYRRSFLEYYNINFNDSRANEDNGFNQLIFLCEAKVKYINYKTYIWCNNKNSLTRKNNYSYSFDLLLGYIYNITWALEETLKRNFFADVGILSFSALLAIYFNYLEFYHHKSVSNIITSSKKIKEISDKYILSDKQKLDIMESQYKNFYNSYSRNFLLNPVITFNEFLKEYEND